MNETRQILQMLEDGKITADQANELLQAIDTDEEVRAVEGDSALSEQVASPFIPPNLARFRHLCRIPFAVSLVVLVTSGWGTYALYRRAEAKITPGFIGVLIVCILAFIATALTLWMTTVPWLHVRIRERDGKRIAISLPLPLTLVGWGLRLAHRYVDDEMAAHLDIAAELVRTTKDATSGRGVEPIVIDVDDHDERVQVTIG